MSGIWYFAEAFVWCMTHLHWILVRYCSHCLCFKVSKRGINLCYDTVMCMIHTVVSQVTNLEKKFTSTVEYGHYGVSNHRRVSCLRNRFSSADQKKISKLRVNGLYEGNSSVTGEFPAQRPSNGEIVSIWWRHHDVVPLITSIVNQRL